MKYNILSANTILNLYPSIKAQTLPVKTTYKMAKLFAALDNENKFYIEELKKIIANFAEKDEEGNPKLTEDGTGFQIRKDCIDECQAAFNELCSIEVDLPDIKFNLEELESLNLNIEQINLFLPFIEE